MKKVFNIYLVVTLLFFASACDKGFEDLNKNPNAALQLEPQPKLTNSILRAAGGRFENWRGNLIYSSMMVQHMAATGGVWVGDKYLYNAQWSGAWQESGFNDQVKPIEDLLIQLNTDEEDKYSEEMKSIVRILRVLVYHRITDLYGDIPYSEAGKGFSDGIFRPKYDPQADIYADMLKELEEATAALGAGDSQFGSADVLFNGNQEKWKRFGNSLMLRLAMRLVKVDAAGAQSWAQKAINGGLMQSNDDIAYVEHTPGPDGINRNGNGEVFTVDSDMRLNKVFIDALTGDPRLRIYAALPDGDEDRGTSGSNDPAMQLGLPSGLDATTLADIVGGDDINNFSEPNRNIITKEDAPYFFQSYAEVEFLLAEANVRWGIGGDAETHYNAGVTAAMKQLDLYQNIGDNSVTDSEVADYLTTNPYDSGNALMQINTQYWIATFLNHVEAYSNWRRTGFPSLTAVNYPGNESNGTIPRRLRYFEREQTANQENYEAAVARQGADSFTTRIWWDVE